MSNTAPVASAIQEISVLNQALASAGVHVIVLMLKEQKVHLPPSARELLQDYALPEVMTWDDWYARFHPDDKPGVEALFAEQFAGREIYPIDLRLKTGLGTWKWVSIRSHIEFREDGTPYRMYGTFVDIDDKKRRDLDAGQRAEQISRATERSGIGLWDWPLNGDTMMWSQALRDLLGNHQEPSRWEAIEERLHPDERELVVDLFLGVLDAEFSDEFDVEHRIRRSAPSGDTYIWVHSRGSSYLDADGRTRIAGTMTNISERKSMEMDLITSEKRFHDVVVTSRHCIIEADDQLRITYASDNVSDLFGIEPDMLTGHCATSLFFDRHSRRNLISASQNPDVMHIRDLELLAGRHSRAPRWIRLNARRCRVQDGQKPGWRGTIVDITNEKKTALALLEAKKAAEGAAEAKAQFLATMSHEIRTPLNAIIGMNELLLATNLDENQRQYTRLAKEAGMHLLNVVNDVLDFSRLEAGRLPIRMSDTGLNPVAEARAVIDMLQSTASRKDLTLDLTASPEAGMAVRGDSHRFRQVLINLIGNAVKFTDSGVVRTDLSRNAHGNLVVAVSDTGIGIPESALGTLFDSFTQVEGGASRSHGGSGLGLAITKRIVELMGGAITVVSEPGVGSTFTVTLPTEANQAPAPIAEPEAHRPPAIEHTTRVLLVDDNSANRLIARTLLERLDYTVTEADNGQRAVELATSLPFDIILMDIEMPVMDGLSATRTLRQNDGPNTATPIVGLTAHDPEQCKALFSDAGMTTALGKPFRVQDLADTVSACLELRNVANASAA